MEAPRMQWFKPPCDVCGAGRNEDCDLSKHPRCNKCLRFGEDLNDQGLCAQCADDALEATTGERFVNPWSVVDDAIERMRRERRSQEH
jgi:hypothetical protein